MPMLWSSLLLFSPQKREKSVGYADMVAVATTEVGEKVCMCLCARGKERNVVLLEAKKSPFFWTLFLVSSHDSEVLRERIARERERERERDA